MFLDRRRVHGPIGIEQTTYAHSDMVWELLDYRREGYLASPDSLGIYSEPPRIRTIDGICPVWHWHSDTPPAGDVAHHGPTGPQFVGLVDGMPFFRVIPRKLQDV